MNFRYGSICSGIEAASVAWHPLGWEPSFFSEIETFPRAVLETRWPGVPLHGDFTTIGADDYDPIDLLVGGTPCQDFSIAGLRAGLDGDRGNLTLEFFRLARRLRPRWIVWENVPGVLSSRGGRDFGAVLGALAELGYGVCWRVLDAQYVRVDGYARAVPQRRRRLFAVGHLGDWRSSAAVLFERESMSGNPPPRREAGKGVAGTISARARGGGGFGTDFDCAGGLIPAVAHALLTPNGGRGGIGVGAIAFSAKDHAADASESVAPTMRAMGHSASHANGGGQLALATEWGIRRLTPRECERLMGFPEVQKTYTILLCPNWSDQQKANALAALQCRRLQNNAWNADASGWRLSAEAVAHHSSTSRHDPAPPVAVDALIDLERQEVQLHSAGRSLSPAVSAGAKSVFPLPTGIGSFVRLVVLLTHAWELATSDGKVGSQPNIRHSSPLLSGNGIAISFGRETGEHARDAANAIETANRLSTSTILPFGFDTETLHSTLTILSCCVVRAISGFIPATMSGANCFAVRLTTSHGYTFIRYRGKPASDGPRYKALGNSMAVNVMRWIGRRIDTVERITREAA